jgi:hypothetical protein
MARKQQWHPVFAALLRPLLEKQYDVQTNVPVGDTPRLADFLLVRRTRAGGPPVAGLWRHLAPWNVLEYKGPTVSPRDEDLEGLAEVGLGIHRRLNEERLKQRQPTLVPADVSFWYLANRLGRRLLAAWERRAGPLDGQGPGLWRCVVLGRLVFLVSGAHLPMDESSLPLHLIGHESRETEEAMARLVAARPDLWEQYAGWMAAFHREAYEGVLSMARTKREKVEVDLEPLVDAMGLERVVQMLGAERVINQLGPKRVINQLGPKRVIDLLGARGVIDLLGVERIWEALTPQERRRLQRPPS